MRQFTEKEKQLFRSLRTPALVQDFLNSIPINFEEDGIDTCKSPSMVMETQSCHCIEGAMLGAYILSLHGHKPLLIHLETDRDWNHVVAVFRVDGLWGAISKTNHAVLRYRDPVYKTIRELVMSYFHEYTDEKGVKTLRRYSKPLDLREFEDSWPVETEDLWGIDEELERITHYDVLPRASRVLKSLKPADAMERKLHGLVEYRPKGKQKVR
jgi:hypothetical protein